MVEVTAVEARAVTKVFGAGPEGIERKRRNQPCLAKRLTAELGNVTPVIVVPGPWSDGSAKTG